MKMTKVREKVMALVAIVIVVVMLAVGTTAFGYKIPGLVNLSSMLGFPPK
ncbi:MAG: hypothetical protein HYV26_19645 [Candidatus Hydrogenedentes bacterium]|nr:hypothetical protein [Candidatus Hydrogenedentota bacterium]MBI3119886.1 hypothetical protein [Candidatus Hydrogenedentota bacterium]